MAAPGAPAPGHPMAEPETPPTPSARDEAEVPLFGTWRRIHVAVVASAFVVMALLALFSRWPF
jgi:hypothetical protein